MNPSTKCGCIQSIHCNSHGMILKGTKRSLQIRKKCWVFITTYAFFIATQHACWTRSEASACEAKCWTRTGATFLGMTGPMTTPLGADPWRAIWGNSNFYVTPFQKAPFQCSDVAQALVLDQEQIRIVETSKFQPTRECCFWSGNKKSCICW